MAGTSRVNRILSAAYLAIVWSSLSPASAVVSGEITITLNTANPANGKQVKPYLVPGMFGGPNNQKIAFLKAMVEAKMHGYTLVIPHFREDWWRGVGERSKLFPLSHFFDVDHLHAFAEARNISLAHSLPDHLVPACLAELQFTPNPSIEVDIPVWAEKFGVLCLEAEFSYAFLANDAEMPGWVPWMEFRDALRPAQNWAGQTDAVLDLAKGVVPGLEGGFHSVHARTEDEFLVMCKGLSWEITSYCFVSEQQITNALLGNWSVAPGELVFISSDAKISELPILCSVFRCFDLPGVWPEFANRSYLEQAHLRFLVALRGKDAFGNIHSTFFFEMKNAFAALGKFAGHYNEPCDSQVQNCTIQGENDNFVPLENPTGNSSDADPSVAPADSARRLLKLKY